MHNSEWGFLPAAGWRFFALVVSWFIFPIDEVVLWLYWMSRIDIDVLIAKFMNEATMFFDERFDFFTRVNLLYNLNFKPVGLNNKVLVQYWKIL
jgi:hypothetical protein